MFLESDLKKLQLKKAKPADFHFRESVDLNSVKCFLKELTTFYESDVRFKNPSLHTYFNYFVLFKNHRMRFEFDHCLKVLCEFTSPTMCKGEKRGNDHYYGVLDLQE